MTISRRNFLRTTATGLALPALSALPVMAQTAEFTYKIGHDMPLTHPLHLRMQEAADKIKAETKGRFVLQIFGNNQLGGDTDMLAQVRSGALEMTSMPDMVLATIAPVAALNTVGFAFSNYDDVWKAMDGDMGAHIRAGVEKSGLLSMEKIWDNGFRQTTSSTKPISTPDDLKGFKIRVPVSPIWMSMYKAFNAGPISLNFSELYSALQTKIAEGQENPLSNIYTAKLYEVQKYLSFTNHIWSGFWILMNPKAWKALPKEIQEIVSKNFNVAAQNQRSDIAQANATLEKTLAEKGMVINHPDTQIFRSALVKAGFYAERKEKFGPASWAVLAKYAKGLE